MALPVYLRSAPVYCSCSDSDSGSWSDVLDMYGTLTHTQASSITAVKFDAHRNGARILS